MNISVHGAEKVIMEDRGRLRPNSPGDTVHTYDICIIAKGEAHRITLYSEGPIKVQRGKVD